MDENTVIKIANVSKTFKLPHEKTVSVKSAVLNLHKHKKSYTKQHVLKEISIEIKKGEFFGIVGRNGSGKSTLLKLLAGIYSPDGGTISIQGKLTPFIELGVGFNPELTGRENVYLNGALLGFSRKEIAAMYKDIVAFAELEKFMDQRLKNYSSGMQVRLAFSIAIRAKNDILVLDEVLAVGDESFQRKCLKIFDAYRKNKQTVVLVTHDMETVKKYCTRAILISEGKIIEQGSPNKIAARYSQLNQLTADSPVETPANKGPNIQLSIVHHQKTAIPNYQHGESMQVSLSWPPGKKVDIVGIAIYSSLGEYIYGTNSKVDKIPVKDINMITYNVDLELGSGNYFLIAGTFLGSDDNIVDFIPDGPAFTVDEEKTIRGEGLMRLRHSWDKSNGNEPGKDT